jgi:hypothetical protein
MQAATGRLVRAQLGPFAVHDIFPSNAEPVIVYDLALWKQNHFVGLDTLAEIRAGEDSDAETDNPITERLHWRALYQVNNSPEGGEEGLLLSPRLSQSGRQLIEAFATSQGMELEASVEIIIQGVARQYRWGESRTRYSDRITRHTHFTEPISIRLQCNSACFDHLLAPSRWKPSKI